MSDGDPPAVRVDAPLDPARRRRFKAAATLLPVAFVAGLEAALRVAGYGGHAAMPLRFMNREREWADAGDGPLMPDPVLFWRPRPGAKAPDGSFCLPKSGFRSAFDVVKGPGVRRALCVGDSNTFGLGVAFERTWPALVAQHLVSSRPGENWEVLNLGVPGYTSWQIRRLVETEAAAMSPDVVVFETGGFNDWIPAVGAIDREQGRAPFWRTLRIVELLTPAPRGDAAERVPFRELATADFAGPRRVPLPEFEDDLRAGAAWCKERGARAVFVVHPLPALTVARNPVALEYAATVRRVASSTGSGIADGWEAFRASCLADDVLFRDFCHPTERGYEVLAPAVADAVER